VTKIWERLDIKTHIMDVGSGVGLKLETVAITG